jgi:hypothetical protein
MLPVARLEPMYRVICALFFSSEVTLAGLMKFTYRAQKFYSGRVMSLRAEARSLTTLGTSAGAKQSPTSCLPILPWRLLRSLALPRNYRSIVIRGPQHLGFCSMGEKLHIKPLALQVAIRQLIPRLGAKFLITFTGREHPALPQCQNFLCD